LGDVVIADRVFVHDRAELLASLLEPGLVQLRGEDFSLTDKGRDMIVNHRVMHGAWAKALPFHIHVGPIGSGNYVADDCHIWPRLEKEGMRNIKAVEMEAAAIGRVAYGEGTQIARDDDPRPTSDLIEPQLLARYLTKIETAHEHVQLLGFDTPFRAPLRLDGLHVELEAIIDHGVRDIETLVRSRPDSIAALRRIPGIGKAKITQYGDALLELLHPRGPAPRVGPEPAAPIVEPAEVTQP
jgi:hypothetical protein